MTRRTPIRIQRKRIKGWRMPPNTVYVGRPTLYGNPFPVRVYGQQGAVDVFRLWWDGRGWISGQFLYGEQMELLMGAMFQTEPHPLRGKNLACWCPITDKNGGYIQCHADVLLSVANDLTMEEVQYENLMGWYEKKAETIIRFQKYLDSHS